MSDRAWRTEHVERARWGRDHFSTLLYAETRAVDHGGWLRNENLRCNNRRHREVAHLIPSMADGSKYPTRLARSEELPGHDDWDCLLDMEREGLIELEYDDSRRRFGEPFGFRRVRVVFLEEGKVLAAAIREHRMEGRGTSFEIGVMAP